MVYLSIFLIAVGLSMDAFAVSLSIGTCNEIESTRGKIRLAAHFGIFQSGMTALGWLAGGTVVTYIQGFDHWIALLLLGAIGINLIRSGIKGEGHAFAQDPSTGKTLVILSIATSIDAFAIGLTISLLAVPIFLSVVVIGVVTALLSAIGLFWGTHLGEVFGKRMEIVGGLILIGIGIEIVISHLVGG